MVNQNQDVRREEEMRISKMISEGAQGILAYYFTDRVNEQLTLDEERLAAKAMVDEGGLGAEIYYNKDEKIANIDVEDDEKYVN